ncbi:sensor histidine kinase [Paenibacillus humicola]|uniref:sensor histidine kinase n=1 Tax=Paenibacillus humicola TaxID=3110540 RepID=UPI00237C086D|nr:HAMP domain-containing sensor histidine kinase [Paenibacillus humicola]
MSIRLRLTLWYSVVLAATLIAFGMAVYFIIHYNSYNDLKTRTRAQAIELNNNLTVVMNLNNSLDLFVDPQANIDNEQYIQIVNYSNNKVKTTSNLGDLQFPYPSYEDLKSNLFSERFVHTKVGIYPFLIDEQPILVQNQLVGFLQVAAYSGREDKLLSDLRTILVFSSMIAVLIAFTIGLFLARQALRPIENIILASNQIQNGADLSVRISREGPNDEMGMLADTLNNMLGRLETTYNGLDEAYKAQRRFVSDASHELRTPLTTIRGNIELLERMWLPELESSAPGPAGEEAGSVSPALREKAQRSALTREALQDIAAEAKRMSSLVNDLLALARADAGYVMEKQVQPLLPIVEDVARRAQLLPRSAEWRIGDLKPLEGANVNAHGDFLRQLFFIFVENAFKYTPSGYVELRSLRAADQVGVVVEDSGIGMDSDEIPHIFERFYRADVSRGKTSGTGLGLSIAKWIIDEHGGSVEVSTRAGEGTTFTVWLPLAFPGQSNQV